MLRRHILEVASEKDINNEGGSASASLSLLSVIVGTEKADIIVGTVGDDVIDGLDNDDVLSGQAGNDRLNGGDGDDRLNGGDGDDYIYAGDGFNFLEGGKGADVLEGGEEEDVASYVTADGGVTVYLDRPSFNDGDAKGDEYISIEDVSGSAFNDTLVGDFFDNALTGGEGDDSLFGADGNDYLIGGVGDDFLKGGAGADILEGGKGKDTLTGGMEGDILDGGGDQDRLDGGLGSDIFVLRVGDNLTPKAVSGADLITDYHDGEDKIGLADSLGFSDLVFTQSGADTVISNKAGEYLAVVQNTTSTQFEATDFVHTA